MYVHVTIVFLLYSSGATEKNDKLCQYLFHEAGKILAKHILALEPKMDQVKK